MLSKTVHDCKVVVEYGEVAMEQILMVIRNGDLVPHYIVASLPCVWVQVFEFFGMHMFN